MAIKRVWVEGTCISCGHSEANCPEVFKMAEEGKAHVIENVDYKQQADKIKQAQESCPATFD